MPGRVYGRTKSGELITDQRVEQLAKEAERGYEPGQLRSRRRGPGRPAMGEATKVARSIHQRPVPIPGNGQALVQMLATGVSCAEQQMRRGRYPNQRRVPFVLREDFVTASPRRPLNNGRGAE